MSTIHRAPAPRSARAALGMIAVAAAAAFLATFNETFLNVALTPIMIDLGVDVATVQWLTTGYLLVAAVFVPVSNVLYHRFPTRPLFVAVAGLFVVGAIISALAPAFGVLLLGRLLQAVGTGLLTPIGMNITLTVAPREKLGTAMGVMAAMTTLGPSLAIVISGALLQVAHWSVLLWVFGALSLAMLIAGAVLLRNVADLSRPTLDVPSFLLVAVALVGLLYGISTIFSTQRLVAAASLLVGLLALALFVRRQRRIASPLLDLRPLASRPFVIGVAMTMLGLLFVFAMNVVIPIFLQSAKGLGPMEASLTLAPGILLTVVLGPVAGRLFDRHGGRFSLPAGYLVMAIFVTLVGIASGHGSVLLFGALYVPAVLATSFVIGPAQTFALSHLDRETSPHGVTIVSTSFQIAGSLGTSLAIGVYSTLNGAAAAAGAGAGDAAVLGFRGAAAVVVVTSLLGIVLAVLAPGASRRARAQAQPGTLEERPVSVADLMKTDVHSLHPEQTVLEALQMFSAHGISGAPVLDAERRAVGFLSDGDVLRYLAAEHPSSRSIWSFATGEDEELTAAFRELASLPVMRLAAREVTQLDAGASIADAVAMLSDLRLKKVPVVDGEDRTVVGVLSRSGLRRHALGAASQALQKAA